MFNVHKLPTPWSFHLGQQFSIHNQSNCPGPWGLALQGWPKENWIINAVVRHVNMITFVVVAARIDLPLLVLKTSHAIICLSTAKTIMPSLLYPVPCVGHLPTKPTGSLTFFSFLFDRTHYELDARRIQALSSFPMMMFVSANRFSC